MAAPTPLELASVKPGKQFNILSAIFVLDSLGNEIPITTVNISSISYTVYKLLDELQYEITTGRQITGSGSFTPSSVISNSMLVGTGWIVASPPNVSAGYNANYPIPGSYITLSRTVYKIQVTITLTSLLQFDDWFTVKTLDVP